MRIVKSFSNFSLETQKNIIPITSCASFLVKLHGAVLSFPMLCCVSVPGEHQSTPKELLWWGNGSVSTALLPAQAHTAICCNSHKTELKGLGEGYCPGSSVLPVLGYYFWKPCFLKACLAQGIMPKQKSFHAGIILRVTGIQQVLMWLLQ